LQSLRHFYKWLVLFHMYMLVNRDKLFRMRFIISFFLLILFSLPLFAQAPASAEKEPSDTIVLISGRKMAAFVQNVSPSKISYFPIGSKELKDMDRKQVHKIMYRNGRVETFNTMAVQVVSEGDWQTVILTDNMDDVEGFFPLGEVQAQSSPKSRNARSARQSADIRLKKRAVNMGGLVVFITKRESKGGYGETPTHYVEGIVYGFEPPAE